MDFASTKGAIMVRTLAIAAAAFIGATGAAVVFQETAASADQPKAQPVLEQNVDPGGAIRVHEQGTHPVNVANSTNTPVPTRDVEREPSQPFQQELHLSSTDDSEDCDSFAVPLLKTLVIEHVAVSLELSGKNEVTTDAGAGAEEAEAARTKLITLETTVGGEHAEYPLLTEPLGRRVSLDSEAQRLQNASLRGSNEPVAIYAGSGSVRACLEHGFHAGFSVEQPDAAATVIVSGRSVGKGLQLPPLSSAQDR